MRAFALNELAAIFGSCLKTLPSGHCQFFRSLDQSRLCMPRFLGIRLVMVHPNPAAWVWPAAMIVWGPGFTSARHSHHCVQLVMVTQGTLRIRTGPDAAWRMCGAALVRPGADHEVDARGKTLLIGFVDPESELGTALAERIKGDISRLAATEVRRWRLAVGSKLTPARVKRWVRNDLLSGRRVVKIHPRVRRVLKYVRENLSWGADLSLKTLADVSDLSPSRLMHVFTASVGVPVRPYILWLRLQRASYELMNGVTVTETAHIAGFSDAAHLTRTFRRMLGTTPTDLAGRKKNERRTIDPTDRSYYGERMSSTATFAQKRPHHDRAPPQSITMPHDSQVRLSNLSPGKKGSSKQLSITQLVAASIGAILVTRITAQLW